MSNPAEQPPEVPEETLRLPTSREMGLGYDGAPSDSEESDSEESRTEQSTTEVGDDVITVVRQQYDEITALIDHRDSNETMRDALRDLQGAQEAAMNRIRGLPSAG